LIALALGPTEHRHELLRREPVALQFTRAERRRHRRAIFIHDGVAAVLPPLILRADRRSSVIFEVAVAVHVAIIASPIENAARGIPVPCEQWPVPRPRE